MAEEQVTDEKILEDIRNYEEETPGEEETPEYTEAEQKAIDMGWNPEGVEGKRSVSAEEFIDRKSLFDRIHKLEKTTKQKDKVVDALKKYNEQIAEKAYERAVEDLKAEKLEALDNQDNKRVLEIDDELDKIKSEKPVVVEEEVTPAYTPEEWQEGFQDFASNNIWYGRRPEMTKEADDIGTAYAQANPDISPEELFAYVQGEIDNKYKEDTGKKPTGPSKVAPAGGKRAAAGSKNKKSLNDVPEEDRDIALTLIKSGTISEEDYIKSYFGEQG